MPIEVEIASTIGLASAVNVSTPYTINSSLGFSPVVNFPIYTINSSLGFSSTVNVPTIYTINSSLYLLSFIGDVVEGSPSLLGLNSEVTYEITSSSPPQPNIDAFLGLSSETTYEITSASQLELDIDAFLGLSSETTYEITSAPQPEPNIDAFLGLSSEIAYEITSAPQPQPDVESSFGLSSKVIYALLLRRETGAFGQLSSNVSYTRKLNRAVSSQIGLSGKVSHSLSLSSLTDFTSIQFATAFDKDMKPLPVYLFTATQDFIKIVVPSETVYLLLVAVTGEMYLKKLPDLRARLKFRYLKDPLHRATILITKRREGNVERSFT